MSSRSDTDALLEQLFELPPAQWPERLDVLCREYPAHAESLRRRHDLLAATGLDAPIERPPALGVPERFGDYRLVRRLGQGGMGMVFVAEQLSLGRFVAIKFVRPELMFSSFARERFRREIDAIAQLDHPGIVPILAHDQAGDTPYYAMPLVTGASGDDVIQRLQGDDPARLTGGDLRRALVGPDGSDPGSDPAGTFEGAWWQACVRLVRQAALALHHAHRNGIVHRDVKPSNLLFTADGRALVVDFGLAHVSDDARITHSGATPGSPAYMAPEQVRGRGIDARADVYSLAISLHHLLALRHPLPLDDSDALRTAILTGRREPLPAGAMPPELAIVLGAAMDLDPDRRHRTAEAFAADLQAVLEQRPIQARSLPRRLRVRRWMQRHPTATTAMALGALLLTATPTLVAFGVAGERDRALDAEAAASRNAYEANLAAASAALRAGDRIEAQRRLDACPPNLRGFEWRHLHQALSGTLREFPGHAAPVIAVAIRSDASWMASADADGRVFVRQPLIEAAGSSIELPDHKPVEAVSVAADGRHATVVQSASRSTWYAEVGPTVRVLDVSTSRVVAERVSTKLGERVCVATDGDSLLVLDGLLAQQLDAFTLAPMRSVELAAVGGTPIGPLAFDGDWLFATAQRALIAWHVADGRGSMLPGAVPAGAPTVAAAVRKGRAVIATPGRLTVADVEPLRVRNVDGGDRDYDRVAMDASGDFIAAVGADHAFRAWSASTGRPTCQAFGGPSTGRAVAIASRRLLAVVGDHGGGVALHGMFGANERQALIGHSGVVSALAPTADGMLVSGAHEPAVRVWNLVSGAPTAATYVTPYWVRGLAVPPSGGQVFVASAQHVLRLRLPDLTEQLRVALQQYVLHLFACDDTRAIAVLGDRLVELDMRAGRAVREVPVAAGRIGPACSVRRGAGALVGTGESIEHWRLSPRLERLATLPVPNATVITCSRDGETMFTSELKWLRRRRVADGAVVWERECARTVTSLLVLPDESRLVTGHDDGSVGLWRPADCVSVATLRAGEHAVCALAADPAGAWLAAADVEATVTLFRAGDLEQPFASRLARADTIAATWLDDRLRAERGARPLVLAAVEAHQQLDAGLRAAMAHAERLRPVVTWETVYRSFEVAAEPGLPAAEYERALEIALTSLELAPTFGYARLAAAFASVRLRRTDDALRHADLAILHKDNPAHLPYAFVVRAMTLSQSGRHGDARAELARLQADLADVRLAADLLRLMAEARRMVER